MTDGHGVLVLQSARAVLYTYILDVSFLRLKLLERVFSQAQELGEIYFTLRFLKFCKLFSIFSQRGLASGNEKSVNNKEKAH